MRCYSLVAVNLGLVVASLGGLFMAFAESPPSSPRSIVLVESAAGAPLSAEQAEERIVTSAGGTRRTEVQTTKVFRDSAGRVRVESYARSTAFVTLLDPVARSVVTLLPATQVASRITAPKSAKGFGFAYQSIEGELFVGGPHTKTDELGIRVIEGIEFRGTRTELTDQKPGSVAPFTERWYCQPLQLTGSITIAASNINHSVALKHIQRGEPEPALFLVPAGYSSSRHHMASTALSLRPPANVSVWNEWKSVSVQ